MEIGIRYCGGCNANYDRKVFINNLIKNLEKAHNFEIAKETKKYDYLILVCGCSNCCLNHEKYIFKYNKIFIKNGEDCDKLLYDLKKL